MSPYTARESINLYDRTILQRGLTGTDQSILSIARQTGEKRRDFWKEARSIILRV